MSSRAVRFICTDGGMHPRRVLETVAPWGESGVRRARGGAVSPTASDAAFKDPDREIRNSYRRHDGLSELPEFDLRCSRCTRNPRAGAAKMRKIVDALLAIHSGDVVEYDVSSHSSSILF